MHISEGINVSRVLIRSVANECTDLAEFISPYFKHKHIVTFHSLSMRVKKSVFTGVQEQSLELA